MVDEYPATHFKFSQEDFGQFRHLTWTYVRVFAALAKTYMERGQLLFDLTIKSHYMVHVMQQAQWLNPRLSWTFSGEDLMHTMKILAQSCVRGTKASKVAAKMLSKYRTTLELRFRIVV